MINQLCCIFLLYISGSSQEILNSKENTNITTPLAHITTTQDLNLTENIICRSCGNELTATDDIISKVSANALHSFYDKIFDDDKILVQILPGEFLFSLTVVTTKRSNCVGVGEWQEKDTWFPGYQWKSCVCPDCGDFVGWIFEPKDSSSIISPDTFYGLILSSLIGESFVNHLITFPGKESD